MPILNARRYPQLRKACQYLSFCIVVAPTCLSAFAAQPVGPIYYFSDCEPGAHSACVPGNNSNAGTRPNAPKRSLQGLDVNSLPAGTQLLFRRGGAFSNAMIRFQNYKVTPAAPLVLDAWGEGVAPILRATSFNGFEFSGLNSTDPIHGGYTLRNLKIDGLGTSQWGVWLRGNVRSVTLENVELTGFQIAIHAQNNGAAVNDGLTLRNVNINRNSKMGLLGDANNLLIENSRFADNNFSGSNYNHAIYLGGRGRNGVLRNNTFINNSSVNGVCTGGNLTVHGQWDGLVVEANTVQQISATDTCYGIVVNGGYTSQEWFRNLVVRDNLVSNVGGCAICLTSAPYAVVENNRVVNERPSYMIGVLMPSSPYEGGDDKDVGAIVRNNVICYAQPAAGSAPTRLNGAGAKESGTVYRTGSDASTGACAR